MFSKAVRGICTAVTINALGRSSLPAHFTCEYDHPFFNMKRLQSEKEVAIALKGVGENYTVVSAF